MDLYKFSSVSTSESNEILTFYRSVLHTPGCTWDEFYPNMETISSDISQHALYCLREESGQIAAVASIGPFAELDDLDWPVFLQTPWELARIGVRDTLQRKGLGTQMLQACISTAKAYGCDGVRLLVACQNIVAQRLYRKNGFLECGKVYRYGLDFYAQQLVFES